ncbi:MAG: hypothetical protein U5L45_08300 [Saprospiraceae bacterium]|nr:hypothetical protein [Saprospiraceae bacterium]
MSVIQEYQDRAKSEVASWRLMRKLMWLLAILLIGFITYAAFIVYYPYSEGTRTGVLQKLSNKGYVIKTWEGELQMRGVLTPQDAGNMNIGGNIWLFSVGRDQDAVIQALQAAESKGSRVTLHYTQYSRQFDWRGETVYFVDKVTQAE